MIKFPEPPDSFDNENEPAVSINNPYEFGLPVNELQLNEISAIIEGAEKVQFSRVEVVYVDEQKIIDINREYLNRDYVTDIISFRYDEHDSNAIEGTLFCCAPRIAEQSSVYSTSHKEEFFRIFIHGLLHLTGYDDQTPAEKKEMTRLEDYYLKKITEAG